MDFLMPGITNNAVGWGPPESATQTHEWGVCDFVEHLDKFPATKIGRICDFTASGLRFQAERSIKGKGKMKGKSLNEAMQALNPNRDDEGFSLVDRPQQQTGKGKGKGAGGGKGKGKGKQVANYQEGILGQRQKLMPFGKDNNKGKGKNKGGLRRGMPSFKDWSVQTRTEWEMKQEINLSSLAKLQLDAKGVEYEDVLWCGTLHNYSRSFDRVSTKTERNLKRFEDALFFSISSSDDPHLPEMLQNDESVTVIATDQVLACLAAASRSVYSWDIIVTKIHNKLIFDKRDGSQVDCISVNETAQEAPNNDEPEHINAPMKLSQEAGCINQNFSQLVLDWDAPAQEMDEPNPFQGEDDEGQAASGAYRYRKITLPGNSKSDNKFEANPVVMAVRTEVNCRMPDAREGKGYVSVKALNEYDSKVSSSWRTCLESQRGACLAAELKNNSFKMGRWTAQAILSGCDTMKVGYVSRVSTSDPHQHSVLGVQTHMTEGFAEQIGLTSNNMFGILRTIINLIMEWDDGKYMLLKDPTKSMLRMYALPWDVFQSDGEDDSDEDDEDDQELDEDGNVIPEQPAARG